MENKEKWLDKVENTLILGGRSKRTFVNYKSHINNFYNYFNALDIPNLHEDDIVEFLLEKYIKLNRHSSTLNVATCSIRFFYSVCFNKELNKKLLPNCKIIKRLPTILKKDSFINIFNDEKSLNHKCWLILAYCSGLRVEEVATIKIENIFSKEHKLKVLGKGNKERFTILPDIVIKYLRLYYKSKNYNFKSGYLFKGTNNLEHCNSKTIINYFTHLKKEYNLDNNITFHSLRHSFATYYLINGGNIITLKSMLGHTNLGTTGIYIHISQNFNKLEGIKYV